MFIKFLRYALSFFKFLFMRIRYGKKIITSSTWYYFGKNSCVIIYNKSKLILNGKIYFSENCSIECKGGNIQIGSKVFFNKNCTIISYKDVAIGDNCIFGPNVTILDHNHRYSVKNILIKDQGFDIRDVIIGQDVWIGANVVITAGSKIGDHVVIGANSVVKGNIESNSLYAGNPARYIKSI